MTDTRRLVVDPNTCTVDDLRPAAEWLGQGGVVAFPTDTLYGLAVDVRNRHAVKALFELKGRMPGAALPLVAASVAQVVALSGPLNSREASLAAACWPGPLSLVRGAPAWLPIEVHGGHRTVAIRVPDHRVARLLAEAAGVIAATSANKSGELPAASAEALGWLAEDPRVWIVDGGRSPGGAPSTLVDVRGTAAVCVREGAVPWNRVLDLLHA